jgi:putative Holliday junction resolvase
MPVRTKGANHSDAAVPSRAVLAIDYGRRRFGLALSDSLGLTARPLAVFERTNRRDDIARLRNLCREHGVQRIVVGWPVRLDGTPGDMAKEAAGFAERLRKHLGRPVDLADERLSSWEAEQQLREWGVLRKGQLVDDLAAAVILRDYLARSQKSDSPAGVRLLPASGDHSG